MKHPKTLVGLALLLVLCAAAGAWWTRSKSGAEAREPVALSLETAREAMSSGKYEQARDLASRFLERHAASADARFVIAECFTKERRLDDALKVYDEILGLASITDEDTKTSYQCAGEILLHKGATRQAEEFFREALKRDPYYPLAHNRLAFMLGLQGRRWESLPHLIELIKQDRFSTFHLLLLANPTQNIIVEDFLNKALRFDPDYPIPRITEAKAAIERGQLQGAAEIVDQLAAYDPQQVEVKMLEGTLHLLRSDAAAFSGWSKSLSLEQESHPECWLLRGRWARQNGKTDVAIRCFAEAFFRDPNSLEACQSLTQLLTQAQQDAEIAEYFKKRTQLLQHLDEISHLLHRNQTNVRLMEEAFACCDWLERYWEAWGWCRAALEIEPNLAWAKSQEADIEKHLVYDLPQTIIFRNINEWDYVKYPLPIHRAQAPDKSVQPEPDSSLRKPAIVFREIGADLGLDFQYEEGHQGDPTDPKEGRRMYEVTGGGVAAIDYDLDLFPDIYFGQGAKNFKNANVDPQSDRLFRNLSARRFKDVTSLCGIHEINYSQGIAVGDLDSDGFPDVYIGNLGENQLYLNNGDGTFSDASAGLPRLKGIWTTSTVIADLNRDGHPDLYDVDYLQAEAYERLCDNEDGYKRACNPRIFPAERDRILLSNADGTFVEKPDALPIEADEGRGLGILIADYFGTGELQIFIANDMTANNFYVVDPGASSGSLSFRDESLIRGLALDRRGRAQACMGVAFGDLDGNRKFDLFVTNFFGDYNTLYLQEQEAFSDLSHSSNLASLSYQFLGFGTQPLDADLDGDLDLFVANGHIDDFRFQGLPYRMRPQFFENDGAGKFRELMPPEAGPYFSRELLGRGVAKLDWNRDGKEDLLVSHLDDPAVLVSNESEALGQSLRLSFVGTKLSRSPLGTTVEIADGDQIRIAQVTAGSGYLASNENLLVLATMQEGPITAHVRWPDQSVSVYENLAPGSHYRIVEGSTRAFLMP